eukprot:Pgem_evm1s2991
MPHPLTPAAVSSLLLSPNSPSSCSLPSLPLGLSAVSSSDHELQNHTSISDPMPLLNNEELQLLNSHENCVLTTSHDYSSNSNEFYPK